MNKKAQSTTIRTETREKDGFEYEYRLTQSRGSRVASYGIPFFERMVDNLATPIDLKYIIEDELSN